MVRVPQEPTNGLSSTANGPPTRERRAGAGHVPAPFLFSRVRLDQNGLSVLQKDIPLTATGGNTYAYNDGAAVSRTAAGNVDAHYLYLARRPLNSTTISLDRFLITNTGIVFSANTGNVAAAYWNLTGSGSHIELSPTEDRIAVCNRNQFANYQDFLIFDAAAFNNVAVQPITGNNLFLVPNSTANDLSSVLPVGGTIQTIPANVSLPLRFLQHFDKKLSPLEFSPNGRFLYVGNGGYAAAGLTNVTYLAQIDLESSPLEVRLQIQPTRAITIPSRGQAAPWPTAAPVTIPSGLSKRASTATCISPNRTTTGCSSFPIPTTSCRKTSSSEYRPFHAHGTQPDHPTRHFRVARPDRRL